MKIQRLVVDGYRGLADKSFDLREKSGGRPHDVVIVTGLPGSGKTRFLEAITAAKEDIAPWGPRPAPGDQIRQGETAAKITIDWRLDEDLCQQFGADPAGMTSETIFSQNELVPRRYDERLTASLHRYDHDPAHGKIEYFHDDRTLARGTLVMPPLDIGGHKRIRLSAELRKYAYVERTMLDICLGYHSDEGKDALQTQLDRFGVKRKILGVKRTPNGPQLYFEGELELSQLSAMERQAAIFATTAVAIGLSNSIVLVDTPELHVPDDLAAAFARAVLALGTNNQVFLATGSRSVINSFPEACVVSL
ncbi:MAG: hypothetical protein HOW73_14200 [Polyangiaceae bacterium]|nr:hypothetical protein [Polyangiaceae bacterium]